MGEGGFGFVFHGMLEDGSDVAVKLLKRVNQDRDRGHHQNLVKLIGVCIEEDRHCLVYGLVQNGSVESHLHGVYEKFVNAFAKTVESLKVGNGLTKGTVQVLLLMKLLYKR